MQSSSGASEMLLALIEDIVDVFLELAPRTSADDLDLYVCHFTVSALGPRTYC